MEWNLNFISEEEFTEHVKSTILKYGEKLESYDLKKFNSNLVDPIKLIFDKKVYKLSWGEIVKNEIFRQRDKSNNNDIGYFHQNIFSYFDNCEVPNIGWDVIYKNSDGIKMPDGDIVHTVYVEIKNKHNTMNSSSSSKTYMKMQNQILHDDDCACFLVESIAKNSQNIKWTATVDGRKVQHKLIRRISMDKFYEIITGEENAYYNMCMQLPSIIEKVVDKFNSISIPNDTVINELEEMSKQFNIKNRELAMAMSVYMLGFGSYSGFNQINNNKISLTKSRHKY